MSLPTGEKKGCEALGLAVLLKSEFLEGLGEDERQQRCGKAGGRMPVGAELAWLADVKMCCPPAGKGEG